MKIIVWADGDSGFSERSVSEIVAGWPKEWGDWASGARPGDMATFSDVHLFAAFDRIDSLAPTWRTTGSKEKVEKEIGNGFQVRLGWTETATDTTLCTQFGPNEWLVQVWKYGVNIRAEIAALLGLPVHKE